MIRNVLIGVFFLLTVQVHAIHKCLIYPQDDVIITSHSVQLVSNSRNLIISPNGDILYNGKRICPNMETRQKAINYQEALRRDLSWIEQRIFQFLETSRVALDRIVVEKLGANSNVRKRIILLDQELKRKIGYVIEHRHDSIVFHHQAINQIRLDRKRLAKTVLIDIVRDSFNEINRKLDSNGNPLRVFMNTFISFQQLVQAECSFQRKYLRSFIHEICQRFSVLEKQRKELLLRKEFYKTSYNVTEILEI